MNQENNQDVDTKSVNNENASNPNPENKKSTTSKTVKGCGIGCAGVIALIILASIVGSISNSSSSSTGSSSSSSRSSSSKKDPKLESEIKAAIIKDLSAFRVYSITIDEMHDYGGTVSFSARCRIVGLMQGSEIPGTESTQSISGTYNKSWKQIDPDVQGQVMRYF